MIQSNKSNPIKIGADVGRVSGTVERPVHQAPPQSGVEMPQETSSSNNWMDACFLLIFLCLAAAIFLPSASEATQVFLLGGCLVVLGVWGRRKFRQK